MSPGFTFERVYLALKGQLGSGRFAPGDHLEPAALGKELNSSITPVRDALHRLVGERIVEAPRSDGFRVPAPTEAELRGLYGWSRMLLDLALRAAPSGGIAAALRSAGADAQTPETEADLFRAIAMRIGNAELETTVTNLNDRLAPLRSAEARIFDDAGTELRTLLAAWHAGDLAALRRGIAAYHRRRQRCVGDILIASRSIPR